MIEEHFNIKCGEHTLSTVLHLPGNGKFPGVILCHGFMGNKIGQHRLFVKTARFFAEQGLAVLRFDYSGCGDSSGDHADLSLHRQVVETQAAISWLADHPSIQSEKITLLGLSMGGCIAALTAARDKRIGRLVLWAPVARPLRDLLAIVGSERREQTRQFGRSDYYGFTLGQDFFRSLEALHPLKEIEEFAGDSLVIHGNGDHEVDCGNARLYHDVLYSNRCLLSNKHSKHELHFINGADHTFSASCWEQEVLELTADFLAPKVGEQAVS